MELAGASLPPQVAGPRLGSVRLRVSHALEAAAAPRGLPRAAFVRVRWWGEAPPGSLFRPALLAQDEGDGEEAGPGGDGDATAALSANGARYRPRPAAVRYPVRAPADRLLEYFGDMGALRMDVVDRETRRKVGVCALSLQVPAGMAAGVRAEDRLATLQRENALCEIHALDPAEAHVVLGYLAVDFEISWADSDPDEAAMLWEPPTSVRVNTPKEPPVRANGALKFFDLPVGRFGGWGDIEGQTNLETSDAELRDDSRGSSMYYKEEPTTPVTTAEDDEQLSHPEESTVESIRSLIEKGHVLQQRMEHAIRLGGLVEVDRNYSAPSLADTIRVPTDNSDRVGSTTAAPIGIGEEPSSSIDNVSHSILNDEHGVESDADWSPTKDNLRDLDSVSEESTNPFAEQKLTSSSLEMAIQEFCCEHTFIESLRLLRDPSNSTSRFSPIRITVRHTDIAGLFQQNAYPSTIKSNEVSAFSVSTSLRKKQWRPGYSCAAPLDLPQEREINESHDNQLQLKFRVHCVNQSDAEQAVRRRKRGLFPRSVRSVDLSGNVNAIELLDQLLSHDKVVIEVPLYVVEMATTKLKKKRRRSCAQAYLKVGFRLRDRKIEVEPVETTDRDNAIEAERESSVQESDDFNSSEVSIKELPALPEISLAQPQQLELAIVFESIAVANITSSLPSGNSYDSYLTVHYSVPVNLSDRLTIVRRHEKIEHKIKCHLTHQEFSTPFPWVAHLGHRCKVFPSKFHSDSVDYFERSILIMEVWETTRDEELSALLGIVKLNLNPFGSFLRSTNGMGLYDEILPFTGISGLFPVQNPFTGFTVGHIRLHACVGFSHQIAVLSTYRAVIALQSIARGVICRSRLGIANHRRKRSPIVAAELQFSPSAVFDGTLDTEHKSENVALDRQENQGEAIQDRVDNVTFDIHTTNMSNGPEGDTQDTMTGSQDAISVIEQLQHPYKNEAVDLHTPASLDATKLHEPWFPSQIQVSIEEARNVLVHDFDVLGKAETCGAFVSWRMMSSTGDSAAYHPVARTHIAPLSTAAIWKTVRDTRVNVSDWHNPVLEVVLWKTLNCSGVDQQSPRNSHSSEVVGKARVDLGLLGRRWAFVDGWYHIIDSKGIICGQIKLRVDFASNFKLPLLSEEFLLQNSEASVTLPVRGFQDVDVASPISTRDSDKASYELTAQDITRARSKLGLQDEVPSLVTDVNCVRTSDINEWTEKNTQESIFEHHVENHVIKKVGDMSIVTGSMVNQQKQERSWQNDADHDDKNDEELADLQQVSGDDLCDVADQALTIDLGMFQPITLASFGIEVVELSPISSGSNTSISIHTSLEPRPSRFEELDSNDNSPDTSVSIHSVPGDGISDLSSEHELGDQSDCASESIPATDETLQGDTAITFDTGEVTDVSEKDKSLEKSPGLHARHHSGSIDNLDALSVVAVTDTEESTAEDCAENEQATTVFTGEGELLKASEPEPKCVDAFTQMSRESSVCSKLSAMSDDVLGNAEGSHEQPDAESLCVLGDVDAEPKCVDAFTQMSRESSECSNLSAMNDAGLAAAEGAQEQLEGVNTCILSAVESGSVHRHLEPTHVDAFTQMSRESSVCADLSVLSGEDANEIAASTSACSEDLAASMSVQSQPTVLTTNASTTSAQDFEPQQATEATKDKLDVVIELLHEILAVCVQNKDATAGSVATATSHEPVVSHEEGLPESSQRYAVVGVCDAQSQSEEAVPNGVPLLSTNLSTVSVNDSEVKYRKDVEPKPPTVLFSLRGDESDRSNEVAQPRTHASSKFNVHEPYVSLPPRSTSLSSPAMMKHSPANSYIGLNSTKSTTNDLWTHHLKNPVRSCDTCLQEESPRLRLRADKHLPRLFAHDSETERIARIMQGTIAYWLKESGDSSEGPDDSDGSDEDYLF